MNRPPPDAGIPVLTEILTPPANNGAPGTAAAMPPKASHLPKEEPPAAALPATTLSADQLRALEYEINERVLQQLLGRIDFVLEQRVRDSLSDVLQTAVEGLAADIRHGLQETLENVIARAVSQELTRLHTTKK